MIRFNNFSFCYEGIEKKALNNINLEIKDGEFILLTGRSGCGKTTALRALNGLIPHFYPGIISGDLLYDGNSLLKLKTSEIAGKIGTVFQDPRSQFFMTDTTRELAFGCMNMGYTREEIIERLEKTVSDLELEEYLNRSIFALSSGEKQQIAIGSIYALSPKVYIFDEPSANLDNEATARLAKIMKKLKADGYTVIVSEHRFHYLRELIDIVAYMEDGRITAKYSGEEFRAIDIEERINKGLRAVYPEMDINIGCNDNAFSQSVYDRKMLKADNLSFGYEKKEKILEGLSFEAFSGDVIGVLGHNGAGKTTLISVLSGLLKEKTGKIYYDGKVVSPSKRRKNSYLVLQDADYQLFTASVEEELTLGIPKVDVSMLNNTIDRLALSEYRDRHPASLSGGQKQRLTIGASIIKNSKILYFDEPTSGLDYDSMIRVSELIKELSESGTIIFIVSHDLEFITNTCTKILDLDSDRDSKILKIDNYLTKVVDMYKSR